MSYQVLGRAIKNEYLALGTFGLAFGSAFLATRGGDKKAPSNPQEAKAAVPINASSKIDRATSSTGLAIDNISLTPAKDRKLAPDAAASEPGQLEEVPAEARDLQTVEACREKSTQEYTSHYDEPRDKLSLLFRFAEQVLETYSRRLRDEMMPLRHDRCATGIRVHVLAQNHHVLDAADGDELRSSTFFIRLYRRVVVASDDTLQQSIKTSLDAALVIDRTPASTSRRPFWTNSEQRTSVCAPFDVEQPATRSKSISTNFAIVSTHTEHAGIDPEEREAPERNLVFLARPCQSEGEGGPGAGPRSAQLVVPEEQKERPLTTAEKHAELLHFIAQKEAKCLELRSQLAMHEEELVQLKRKWERIINRGLERENSTTISSPAYPTNPKDIPAALMSLTTNPTLTLEGIREGVQGMSRLLAAGLSISTPVDQPRPPKLGVPSSKGTSSPIPPSPLSQSSTALPSGRVLARHVTRESDSSNATWTTRSSTDANRLSQCSSVTSLEDDERAQSGTVTLQRHSKNASIQSSPQELLLMDTGATPTMSPNPRFLEQKARRRKRLEEKKSQDLDSRKSSPEAEDEWEVWGDDKKGKEKEGQRHDRVSATTTSMQAHSGTFWLMDPPPKPVEKTKVDDDSSSWMGTMGKKLGGELQKSGNVLSKTQKRASLMLSDMSQSLLSTLSSPPVDTPSMSLTASPTVSSISTSPSSPFPAVPDPMFGLVSPVASSKPSKRQSLTLSASLSRSTSLSRNSSSSNTKANGSSTTTKSLLDDDDGDDGFGPMVSSASVLKPDNVKTTTVRAVVKKVAQDDDDEWNW
ncbi:hypothetical protein NMY22_g5962 [Coprinellus aureogranulatus]|nr:hypothetical protein NMY22_g5962 [Coprinellus aureogranulatus]